MGIDWPAELERTPADERSSTSSFKATLGQTTEELETELDRLDAEYFRCSIGNTHTKSNGMPLHNANPDDPGFVLQWTADGRDYAVGCDAYTHLRDNVREVFLWMRETRLSGDRPVVTGQSQFAAAALPPGEGEKSDAIAVAPTTPAPSDAPHEVLGVAPDADPTVVEAAARQLKAKHHPDGSDPDAARFKEIVSAEEELLDE